MLYFGYGSNANLKALRTWLADRMPNPPHVDDARLAILDDYRIRTNYFSQTHGAGAANIEPAEGHRVEGVLLPFDTELRDALRRKEGWPHNYEEQEVRVIAKGERRSRRAFTYIVAPGRQRPHDLAVSPTYREMILEAAHELSFSAPYRRLLNRVLVAAPSISKHRRLPGISA